MAQILEDFELKNRFGSSFFVLSLRYTTRSSAVMESSRIYVRGLPPSMKEDEFRKHFSSFSETTDAKYLPRRRIGYVGYRTAAEAAKAVKYYNKSYIRMSKIFVEIARPIVDSEPQNATNTDAESAGIRAEKRNHATLESGMAVNPRLQEFLEVMKPASKGNVWSNEDGAVNQGTLANTNEELGAVAVVEVEQASDDEYEHVPKKRKTSITATPAQLEKHLPDDGTSEPVTNQTEKPVPVDPAQDGTGIGAVHQRDSVHALTTNDDWLRSRTSRRLGMLNDDELDAEATVSLPPKEAGKSKDRDPAEHKVQVVESSDKVQDVNAQEDLMTSDHPVPEPEARKGSNRLFVRNLPFDATQDDILACFGSYGNIEEVRYFGTLVVHYTFYDEQPDRDSLCHAYDVNRKRIF